MSIELRNINGNTADIVEKDSGWVIVTWTFQKPPSLNNDNSIPVKKLLMLKEAGFETEEIIKLTKEINIE